MIFRPAKDIGVAVLGREVRISVPGEDICVAVFEVARGNVWVAGLELAGKDIWLAVFEVAT